MATEMIGLRLRALREDRAMSQEAVSSALGFNDRQTLSAIETGMRRLSADELLRAATVFGVDLDTLTDPFLLVGEGRFSWRQDGVLGSGLKDYELDAGRFISAFRTFATEAGERPNLLRKNLRLTAKSRFEDASAAGERFAEAYDLGDVPSSRLAEVMEKRLDIQVLMVDAIPNISGAACRLSDLDVVLINRREGSGRRHFDLAHELFHILTWDAMPPAHVEEVKPVKRSRVEQLADNFASAVLMPSSILARFGDWSSLDGNALIARLNKAADELQVTASALRWRLVALGQIDKAVATDFSDERLRFNGRPDAPEEQLPPLFSKTFVEVMGQAISGGRVSVRRLSKLLGLSLDDLADLFVSHGVATPFDL